MSQKVRYWQYDFCRCLMRLGAIAGLLVMIVGFSIEAAAQEPQRTVLQGQLIKVNKNAYILFATRDSSQEELVIIRKTDVFKKDFNDSDIKRVINGRIKITLTLKFGVEIRRVSFSLFQANTVPGEDCKCRVEDADHRVCCAEPQYGSMWKTKLDANECKVIRQICP
jgi:hypothetical protein